MDDNNDQDQTDRSEGDPPSDGRFGNEPQIEEHPDEENQEEGRSRNGVPSGEDGSGGGVRPPPRRARQRLEHELDELRDTVDELRDELASLRGARADRGRHPADGPVEGLSERPVEGPPEAPEDRPGPGPGGTPVTVAELHQQLYREPSADDDPGGDIVMLTSVVSEHSAALQELDRRQPVLPCWAEMDRDQATKAWEQLVDWLCGVLIVRYPASARTLRPCWYLHPELVENLSWLHNAWTLAYRDGNSSISMAADWHLYWLPHVMRIAGEATRKCYDAGRHDPNSNPDLTADNAVGISEDLNAHVRADLRNRPEPDDPTPRGYVVPPVRPGPPPPWSSYRRSTPAPTDTPGAGRTPAGPDTARSSSPTTGHNPYQPR